MGSASPKAPLRTDQVRKCARSTIMEVHISGSFYLSCVLRHSVVHRMSPGGGCCGRGRGGLDSSIFSHCEARNRRTLGSRVDSLPGSTLRSLSGPSVSRHQRLHHRTITTLQLHILLPS